MAATSNCEAFAVGSYLNGSNHILTLIERWTGTAWRVPKSPNPGGPSHDDLLLGVAATSPTNAWAVGYHGNRTLIEHWNGTAWKVQRSPTLSGALNGVAATSAHNAWAVGRSKHRTLIEHWNGTAWKVQRSPTF